LNQRAAHPPGILGSDQGRSGAEEGIKNNLAPVCEVTQGVFEHGNRFHRQKAVKREIRDDPSSFAALAASFNPVSPINRQYMPK
jgi:hypothetical protein